MDENKVKRRYDIGNGVTITADKWTIRAEWKTDGRSTRSIGIRRPPPKPGDKVRAVFSLDGKMFYLPDYAHAGFDGFWLGVKTWDSKEEMGEQQQANFWGDKPGSTFTPGDGPNAGKTYHREIFHFNCWSVKHKPETTLSMEGDEGELVKDYLALCQSIDTKHEAEFNKEIAFSGWTLSQILDAIGPWVPVEDIPVVKLEKKGG